MKRLGNVVLVLVSILFALVGFEVGARLVGFDFQGRLADRIRNIPIYYRAPSVPMGNGLLRRPGPAVWEGQVIASGMRATTGSVGPYGAEPSIRVEYDSVGFRNPPGLDDWEIVFLGDSFTELGHLPWEDLFSTRVGAQLGKRAKNLGVSLTSTLSQAEYFGRYGISRSTSDAVLVFFEGNDFHELADEALRMDEAARGAGAAAAGEAPSSPLRSIWEQRSKLPDQLRSAARAGWRLIRPEPSENAYFLCGGDQRPVTVAYAPPGPDDVATEVRQRFEQTIEEWALNARENEVQPWIVFMPTKHRVLHGHLRYVPSAASFASWDPNAGLSAYVASVARHHEIPFVDLTPALTSSTAGCELPYNSVWDTHLNGRGSEIVAMVIAAAMAEGSSSPPIAAAR